MPGAPGLGLPFTAGVTPATFSRSNSKVNLISSPRAEEPPQSEKQTTVSWLTFGQPITYAFKIIMHNAMMFLGKLL